MENRYRLHRWLCGLLLAALCSIATGGDAETQPPGSPGWYSQGLDLDKVGPTTFERRPDWVVARNLFFHVHRFCSVFPDGDLARPRSEAFSFNTPAHAVPVRDVRAFYGNLRGAWVAGTTLWVDFPFPALPNHLGHWMETLAPLYSHLAAGAWREAADAAADAADAVGGGGAPHVRTLLVPGLQREGVQHHPYAEELIRLAVAPALAPGQPPPALLFWEDLEGLDTATWLGFERALRIYSRYDHPEAHAPAFATPAAAAAFRAAVYAATGVPPPAAGAPPPRQVTYLMAADGAQKVSNSAQVLEALREGAAAAGMRVRPYSPSESVALASLAAAMASTGLLVGRNGPLLAAAVLLPPGAAVVELLPHNWEYDGVNQLFVNLTRAVGDVAHVAWRAPGHEFMTYATPSAARYARWSAEECTSRQCLEAQEEAALRVDPAALAALVGDVAAAVARGDAPAQTAARHPWPAGAERVGSTGLWWDVK